MMDVGELVIAKPVPERQSLVIEAEQVQDRRVEVRDRHRILHRLVSELVCHAVDRATAHAATCEP